MSSITPPAAMLGVMVTVLMLSTHASDEQYLSDEHPTIKVSSISAPTVHEQLLP